MLPAPRPRGIAVCNTPDVLSVATAETALLLILAAARRAGEGERLIRSGRWQGWAPTQLLGTGVVGRRLGIFGMGRIGRELARMARGIGMTIHLSRCDEAAGGAGARRDLPRHRRGLSGVMRCAEPARARRRRDLSLAERRRIAMLPRGAVVVNAARGTLVDDAALIAALQSGQVGFAGLDVFEGEPGCTRAIWHWRTWCCCRISGSATVATRDAMGFLRSTGLPPCWRAGPQATS